MTGGTPIVRSDLSGALGGGAGNAAVFGDEDGFDGAYGGVAVGHLAGSWAVMPTLLHALSHVSTVVMFAPEQKFRQGCVKVTLKPHGALMAGGGEHGAGW